ncbi:MAG: PAS domain S-box protein [Comamonadaceae bacterium]|nr:PAS domain S-box protein [Comamonadaceae bacterium]
MHVHVIQPLNLQGLARHVDVERVHPEDMAQLQALLECPESVDAPYIVFRTIDVHGACLRFELWAQTLNQTAPGKATPLIGVLTDITERNRLAEHAALQQKFLELLAQSPDRPTLVAAMLDTVLGLSDLDGGGLYWERGDGGYELLVSKGLSDGFLEQAANIEPDDPRAGIIKAGTMVCSCVDPQEACTDAELVHHPSIAAEGIVALMVLPITVAGRGRACLNLASKHVRRLPVSAITLLQRLAEQFGLAIERLVAREDAQNQRQNLEGFFHALQDYVFVLDEQGAIQYVNPAVYDKLGYDSTLLGKSVLTVHPERVHASAWSIVTEMLQGKRESCPLPLLRADGSEFMVDTRIVHGGWNAKPALLGVSRDISQREADKQALQASLHEKEALLKEVHHRVKNNLQIISSLIRLEAGRSHQEEVQSVLGDMQGRIRSMALLHELLYRSQSLAQIDMGQYLRQLASQVFSANVPKRAPVDLTLDITPVSVTLDQAIPCGLLANELITNALKHGFPGEHSGGVRVEFCPVDALSRWCLTISDSGVGLPDDFESKRQASLGLQLASGLANQLGGELCVGPGARFSVSFSIAKSDKAALP